MIKESTLERKKKKSEKWESYLMDPFISFFFSFFFFLFSFFFFLFSFFFFLFSFFFYFLIPFSYLKKEILPLDSTQKEMIHRQIN